MPKTLGSNPNRRKKQVIVITRPYCSPDPAGPNCEQYCRQSLMQHKAFRHMTELLAESKTYAEAYAIFLQSVDVPLSLEDDIFRLHQQTQEQDYDTEASYNHKNLYLDKSGQHMYIHVSI